MFGRDRTFNVSSGVSVCPAMEEGNIMGLIITLIVGGIIGWLASIVMRTDAQQGIILNVVVGIVGAFLGNFIGGFFGMGASLETLAGSTRKVTTVSRLTRQSAFTPQPAVLGVAAHSPASTMGSCLPR